MKQRVFILTDIENEPDDTQSLIRLLLYSNVLDIEGLIATTSVHLRHRTAPETIHRVLDAYEKVRPNLESHEPGFPSADSLRKVTGSGQPGYGLSSVGEGQDSFGSRLLIEALSREDERPLWVCVWGGPNTLAQALFTLSHTKHESAVQALISRLRVHTISDQDNSASWIRSQYPDLFYIVSPGAYEASTWGGINQPIPGIDNTTISNAWLAAHIQQGHGPLGAAYPDVAYGMEGDTPSYLGLIPNGLNSPENPHWGGWGGRYVLRTPRPDEIPRDISLEGPTIPEVRPIWTNTVDEYRPLVPQSHGAAFREGEHAFRSFRATLWRWRDEFQNDFAARMDWTIKPYSEANHPPLVRLTHPNRMEVHSGEHVTLDASPSQDPDGDSLSFHWFHYREPGSFADYISLHGTASLARRSFVAPEVTAPETAHFIVKVTDKGEPPLTRYERVIVTIHPRLPEPG